MEEGTSKQAVMSACLAPVRTCLESARSPVASARASTRMDLPAPVSPVSAVNPGSISNSAESTTARFRIARWVSMDARSAGFLRCRPLAPVQLFPEHGKVVVVGGMDQIQPARRTGHVQRLAVFQNAQTDAVATQGRSHAAVCGNRQRDLGGAGYDQRPVVKLVRTDGHQDRGVQTRVDDRGRRNSSHTRWSRWGLRQ